jgi:acetylornithine deacetylase/succinyl-diaminopimelate desuccinylase-like protein
MATGTTVNAPASSRDAAIASVIRYARSGAFEQDLARRVSIRTESQKLPSSAPLLETYLTREMVPAFETLGFTCQRYDNPIAGQPPVLLATRIEDPRLPTVLSYGHGDVIHGLDDRWTRGKGPWTTARDDDRIYGRGTADNKAQHTINIAALAGVKDARGGRLGFNTKFIIEMGEETGSRGLKELVAANREDFLATVFIASDGPRVAPERPTIVLGNRGALTFDLVCTLREGAHHSGNWGGLIADPAIILAHAIASIVGPKGGLRLRATVPPPIPTNVRAALADVTITGGDDGPEIQSWWGEHGLSAAEKVYAWNSLAVLAMVSGNPDAPVNAIAPSARARMQLRYVVGTPFNEVVPALRRHFAQNGFTMIEVIESPEGGAFAATRTDPDHPWALWARRSIETTTGAKPVIVPSSGGSVPNDIFQDVLGLPTIWIPHSYAGCAQHAPDEHVLMPVVESALAVMAGLYWDLGAGNTPSGDAAR